MFNCRSVKGIMLMVILRGMAHKEDKIRKEERKMQTSQFSGRTIELTSVNENKRHREWSSLLGAEVGLESEEGVPIGQAAILTKDC